jgi:carbon storage regulator CsrA
VLVIREVRGRQVKIGIEAPGHVRVLREEIYEELCLANQQAASEPAVPAALTALDAAPPP